MTEHKFTGEEIIKALERCGSSYQGDVAERCIECPLDKCGEANCFDTLLHDLSLDLIKRQKAEIEEKSKRLREVLPIVAELKAVAVKEFAEGLKTYYRHIDKTAGALIEYTIDAKVKEFLGGVIGAADSQDNA